MCRAVRWKVPSRETRVGGGDVRNDLCTAGDVHGSRAGEGSDSGSLGRNRAQLQRTFGNSERADGVVGAGQDRLARAELLERTAGGVQIGGNRHFRPRAMVELNRAVIVEIRGNRTGRSSIAKAQRGSVLDIQNGRVTRAVAGQRQGAGENVDAGSARVGERSAVTPRARTANRQLASTRDGDISGSKRTARTAVADLQDHVRGNARGTVGVGPRQDQNGLVHLTRAIMNRGSISTRDRQGVVTGNLPTDDSLCHVFALTDANGGIRPQDDVA